VAVVREYFYRKIRIDLAIMVTSQSGFDNNDCLFQGIRSNAADLRGLDITSPGW
jgi:hypothetical protein